MKLSTPEDQAVRSLLTAAGVIESDQDTSLAVFLRDAGDMTLNAWRAAHHGQRPIDIFTEYGSDAGRVACVLLMRYKGEETSDER